MRASQLVQRTLLELRSLMTMQHRQLKLPSGRWKLLPAMTRKRYLCRSAVLQWLVMNLLLLLLSLPRVLVLQLDLPARHRIQGPLDQQQLLPAESLRRMCLRRTALSSLPQYSTWARWSPL